MRVEDEHPVIVSRREFGRIAKMMRSRAPKKVNPRRISSPYLLSGLAKCETCGKAITAAKAKSGKYIYCICHSLLKHGKGTCKDRRHFLDSADTIATFAGEMSDFLKTSELTETRAFVHSFVTKVDVKPGKATIVYSIPTPDDSPMGGADTAEVALNGRAMNSVHAGGPGRDRTYDQSVMSRPL